LPANTKKGPNLEEYLEKLRNQGRLCFGVRTASSVYVVSWPRKGGPPWEVEKISGHSEPIGLRRRVKIDHWIIEPHHSKGQPALGVSGGGLKEDFHTSAIREVVGLNLI
jgi:hypothetical protein